MMAALAGIGLPEIVAIAMVVALNAYVVTGGADFGGGVWDLLARGPRRDDQRRLIADTIGPIWEANHVWLILVLVILFTAFPSAFATLSIVLHIPLSLMLLGIVLRGSSFVFRAYGARDDATQRRWGLVFSTASVVTPLLLGTIVGAVASGAVGQADGLLARASAQSPATVPSFASVYVTPWLAPLPLAMGVLALTMFAYLAAVYLAAAARYEALRNDFRRRAIAAALALFVVAFGVLAVSRFHAPRMTDALMYGPALVLQVAIGVAALAALASLYARRWRLARVTAAAQVSLILWGWVVVQYPYVIPPSLTLRDAAAPRITLQLLLGALVAGGAVLVPSLVYLFRTFAAAGRDGTAASDRAPT